MIEEAERSSPVSLWGAGGIHLACTIVTPMINRSTLSNSRRQSLKQ